MIELFTNNFKNRNSDWFWIPSVYIEVFSLRIDSKGVLETLGISKVGRYLSIALVIWVGRVQFVVFKKFPSVIYTKLQEK